MGLVYTDYKQITTTNNFQKYLVGTVLGTEFVSVSSLFYASEDVLIQFNDDGKDILIIKGMLFTFDRKLYKVNVKQSSVSGTIDMWFEGSQKR